MSNRLLKRKLHGKSVPIRIKGTLSKFIYAHQLKCSVSILNLWACTQTEFPQLERLLKQRFLTYLRGTVRMFL